LSALIQVHKVMIATALLFCLGFALRGFALGELGLGATFTAATAALAFYFRWFLRTKARAP
jgi:hypothetical protein